jgi:hypothetical protein
VAPLACGNAVSDAHVESPWKTLRDFPPPSHNRLDKSAPLRCVGFFHSHLENFFKGIKEEEVFHSSTGITNIKQYKRFLRKERVRI